MTRIKFVVFRTWGGRRQDCCDSTGNKMLTPFAFYVLATSIETIISHSQTWNIFFLSYHPESWVHFLWKAIPKVARNAFDCCFLHIRQHFKMSRWRWTDQVMGCLNHMEPLEKGKKKNHDRPWLWTWMTPSRDSFPNKQLKV